MAQSYLVIGAGGTGGGIAGYMAKAGKNVTLIARGENLQAIRTNGLRIENGEKSFTAPVRAVSQEEYKEKADIIFVCVKGYSVDEIYPLIRQAAHTRTIVIPVLNIYGTGEMMAKQLAGIQVLNGCIYIAAAKDGAGVIKQSGDIFRIVYGSLDGTTNDAMLIQTRTDLKDSGISVVYSDNIRRDTMLKFSFISSMAATGAFFNSTAGQACIEGEIRETFKACVAEIAGLAKAMDIALPDDLWDKNSKIMAALAYDCTASMQKDLEAGGRSEMDGLIFEVVRMGHHYNVSVPTYEKIAKKFGMQC